MRTIYVHAADSLDALNFVGDLLATLRSDLRKGSFVATRLAAKLEPGEQILLSVYDKGVCVAEIPVRVSFVEGATHGFIATHSSPWLELARVLKQT